MKSIKLLKIKKFLSVFFTLFLLSFCITACAQNKTQLTTHVDSKSGSLQDSDKEAPIVRPKKVSILGDSYSTFDGYIPEGFVSWYHPAPKEGRKTDVTEVSQTWWDMYIKEHGYELEANNSYSGSTICNTGYAKNDYSDRSFITRVDQLGNPDIIFVYGATNDSWADVPLGDFVYKNWTKDQLYSFRPATSFLLNELKRLYPAAETVLLINGTQILKPEIISSMQDICQHYNVKYVMINDLDTMSDHPSQKGMRQIVDYLDAL